MILDCVDTNMDTGLDLYSLDLTGRCLTEKALSQSLNKDWFSPFSLHAEKYKKEHRGGKTDDITVIVAQIQNNHHWSIYQEVNIS